MSSEIPPTYYFSGITYNPDFYQTSSSSYLNYPIAQGTETIKSLRSAAIDSTSASTNMTLGSNLTSGTLTIGGSSLHTGTISLGAAQTTGALNIGNGARTGNGAINIGNQAAGNIAITVGTDAKTTTGLKGTVSVSSSMNTTGIVDTGTISTTGNLTSSGLINGSTFQNALNSFTVTGNGVVSGTAFQAGTAITVGGLAGIAGGIHVTGEIRSTTGNLTASAGNIIATAGNITAGGNFIGAYQNASATPSASITSTGTITGASLALGSGAIGCGAITTTTTGLITANNGITIPSGKSLTANGGIITGTIDTSTNATTLKLGSNITTVNIEIGGALTSGDIIIGNNNTTGATITIGKPLTETTINGTLTTTNAGILGGGISYIQFDAATLSLTGTYSYMLFVKCGVTASQTITLPAAPKVNQYITFRVIKGSGGTVTINSGSTPSTNIYQNTSITAVSSVILANSWAFNIYFDGTQWMEH